MNKGVYKLSNCYELSPVEREEAARFSRMFDTNPTAAFNGLVSVCVGIANRLGYVGETLKEIPKQDKVFVVLWVLLSVAHYGNFNLISKTNDPHAVLMQKFDEFAAMC